MQEEQREIGKRQGREESELTKRCSRGHILSNTLLINATRVLGGGATRYTFT